MITKKIEDLIVDFIKSTPGYENVRLFPGSPLYEIVVRALAISMSGFENLLKSIEDKISLGNKDALSLEDLKILASNLLVDVSEGAHTEVPVRILFDEPKVVTIDTTTEFLSADGNSFHPKRGYIFSANEVERNLTPEGFYYVDITLVSTKPGVRVDAGMSFSADIPGYIDIYSTRAAISQPADTYDTVINKLNVALTTRELVTTNSIRYFLASRAEWAYNRFLVIGGQDFEIARSYVNNVKTGHAIDIYLDMRDYGIDKATVEAPLKTASDDWFSPSDGFYSIDIGYSRDAVYPSQPQNGPLIEEMFSLDSATLYLGEKNEEGQIISRTMILPVHIGSEYGRGRYGEGVYGVGKSFLVFIRPCYSHYYRSSRQLYRIYMARWYAAGYNTLIIENLLRYANYNSLISAISEISPHGADYLVREFLIGKVKISFVIESRGVSIDVPLLKSNIKKFVESLKGEQGVDFSGIVKIVEEMYPIAFVRTPPLLFMLDYELPDGTRRSIYSNNYLLPPDDYNLKTTARLYRYVIDENDIQITVL